MNLINSEFKIEKIVVGQIETNCYFVILRNNKAVIIDPGDNPEEIINFLHKKGICVHYILNTHGHYDHIGANRIKLDIKPQPLLGIHQDDIRYLSDNYLNLSISFGVNLSYVAPDILLEDCQVIKLSENSSMMVIHTPGHTPGSICLQIDNYLFSGDLLFREGVGRTDLPGGDEKALIKSLKKIARMRKNTIILPGHGPETTLAHELETNPYLDFNGFEK